MKALANNQTISWFNQRLKEDSLELSPDFQRNPVWQRTQKDYLIETILLELPVPEIYMLNRITANGESKFIIVDGQQRLRTILEFINDEFTMSQPIDKYPGVTKFKNFADDVKQKIWRYPLVVRDLEDSTDEAVRDLFQRLNRFSFKLNEQELRNAKFKGHFLKAIEKISENEFWVTSKIFSPNDFRRMLDLEYIGILLSSMIGGIYNQKERLDEFYNNYEKEFDDSSSYIDKFNRNLTIIERVVAEIKNTRFSNKSDFLTLFLYIDSKKIDPSDENIIPIIRAGLIVFEEKINQARLQTVDIEQKFIDYSNAATAGTNSKEARIIRLKIMTDFIDHFIEKNKETT